MVKCEQPRGGLPAALTITELQRSSVMSTVNSNIPMSQRARAKGKFAPMLKPHICVGCNVSFQPKTSKQRLCSRRCPRTNGRYIDQAGYVVIKQPDHPHAALSGWVREHTVVVCEMFGRNLLPGELVHHIDGDRANNSPGNLEVVGSIALHRLKHRKSPSNLRLPNEDNPTVICVCGCGESFLKFDKCGRPRRYVSGHNGRINHG